MEVRVISEVSQPADQHAGRAQQRDKSKSQRYSGKVRCNTAESHQARAHEPRQPTPDGWISQQEAEDPATDRSNQADFYTDPICTQNVMITEKRQNIL